MARQTFSRFFPHAVVATPAGEERVWKNNTDVPWTVDGFEMQADLRSGTSGATVVKMNTDGVGGSSTSISLSMAYNEKRKSSTDSLEIAPGATLYIFILTANGGHEDVEVMPYLGSC